MTGGRRILREVKSVKSVKWLNADVWYPLSRVMDKAEAQKVFSEQLARFSRRSYSELVSLVQSSHVEDFEVRGASGTTYQVEVQFFWDDKPKGVIRVVGSIDDGGIRAFVPLTETFLVSRPPR